MHSCECILENILCGRPPVYYTALTNFESLLKFHIYAKSDTSLNYVNVMSYKLQNIRYLFYFNDFNSC